MACGCIATYHLNKDPYSVCAVGVRVRMCDGVKMFTSAARLSARPSSDAGGESSSFPLLSSLSLTLFLCCTKRHGDTAKHYSGLKSACFACTILGGKGSNSTRVCVVAVILPGSSPTLQYADVLVMTLCDVKDLIRS